MTKNYLSNGLTFKEFYDKYKKVIDMATKRFIRIDALNIEDVNELRQEMYIQAFSYFKNFNPNKSNDKTYITNLIKWGVRNYLSEKRNTLMRVPRRVVNIMQAIRKTDKSIYDYTDEDFKVIADKFNTSKKYVIEVVNCYLRTDRVFEQVDFEGDIGQYGVTIEDEKIDNEIDNVILLNKLHKYIDSHIPEKQKGILLDCYKEDEEGKNKLTGMDIAKKYGVSYQYVSQVKRFNTNKLRKEFANYGRK